MSPRVPRSVGAAFDEILRYRTTKPRVVVVEWGHSSRRSIGASAGGEQRLSRLAGRLDEERKFTLWRRAARRECAGIVHAAELRVPDISGDDKQDLT